MCQHYDESLRRSRTRPGRHNSHKKPEKAAAQEKPLVPFAPQQNGVVEEGIHEAIIVKLRKGSYNGDSTYRQALLWLPEEKRYVATNFYFPKDQDHHTDARLAAFCDAVGLDPCDCDGNPGAFVGKRLAVQITTCVNRPPPYSDVAYFLSIEILDMSPGYPDEGGVDPGDDQACGEMSPEPVVD